jgi:hypothetical protein
VCDNGDGGGGVVQYGVGDRADVGAERAPADAAADDDQGSLVGGADQVSGGRSVRGLLDHLDDGELLPPRAQDVARGGGLLPGQPGVEFEVGGEAVGVVGRRVPAVNDPQGGGAAVCRVEGELDESGSGSSVARPRTTGR